MRCFKRHTDEHTLTVGIYSLTWVFQTLYHTLPAHLRAPPNRIAAHMSHYDPTDADEATTMMLTFPRSTPTGKFPYAHAVAMTHLRIATDPDEKNSARPAIRIQGTGGEIQVDGPAFRPSKYRIISKKEEGKDAPEVKEVECEFPGGGHGMFWEADEAARCVRDGKLESEGLTLEESVVIMEVMDEVRKQGGLVYPESIESTEYPVELPGMK